MPAAQIEKISMDFGKRVPACRVNFADVTKSMPLRCMMATAKRLALRYVLRYVRRREGTGRHAISGSSKPNIDESEQSVFVFAISVCRCRRCMNRLAALS